MQKTYLKVCLIWIVGIQSNKKLSYLVSKSMFIRPISKGVTFIVVVVVVALLFYVHGKHLRSCRDGQLTYPHFSWAGLDLLSG